MHFIWDEKGDVSADLHNGVFLNLGCISSQDVPHHLVLSSYSGSSFLSLVDLFRKQEEAPQLHFPCERILNQYLAVTVASFLKEEPLFKHLHSSLLAAKTTPSAEVGFSIPIEMRCTGREPNVLTPTKDPIPLYGGFWVDKELYVGGRGNFLLPAEAELILQYVQPEFLSQAMPSFLRPKTVLVGDGIETLLDTSLFKAIIPTGYVLPVHLTAQEVYQVGTAQPLLLR